MSSKPSKEEIKIMTYNVLAHCATKHNELLEKNLEKIEEMTQRYNKIVNTLDNSECDVILLQEVDKTLFEQFTDKLINYTAYSNVVNYKNNARFETCVLFNKSKFICKKKTFISSEDKNIYDGKNAYTITLESILNKGKEITFVSVHLSGKDKIASKNLLTEIGTIVSSDDNVIVAGDFNCDYTDPSSGLCQTGLTKEIIIKYLNGEIKDDKLNSNFKEAVCGDDVSYVSENETEVLKKCGEKVTTCHFDYATESASNKKALIDRIFYKGVVFNHNTYDIITPGCDNYQIWTRPIMSPIKNASDHFPLIGVFSIHIANDSFNNRKKRSNSTESKRKKGKSKREKRKSKREKRKSKRKKSKSNRFNIKRSESIKLNEPTKSESTKSESTKSESIKSESTKLNEPTKINTIN